MRRFALCAVVAAYCLGLVGCSTAQQKQKDKSAIEAPGIDQLQQIMQKADVLYQTRDYSQSKIFYTQITNLDPKNLKALYRLGNIAFRSRDWREAVTYYEKVIALEPRHTRAQYNLSMTYLTLAERHLKFYAANVDSNTNLESVTRLTAALEEISNPQSNQRGRSIRGSSPSGDTATSLDKLLDELSR